jgi:alcohol dehydrogenase, propanol-preferring
MKKTMKAAVVRELGKPLTIEDVPIPQPGPGQGACEGPGVRGVWD